jgi:hypothetical protein
MGKNILYLTKDLGCLTELGTFYFFFFFLVALGFELGSHAY